MANVHIRNLARGELELVTLGYFLPNKGVSKDVYDEEKLRSNAEIAGLKARGFVDFVTEGEYQAITEQQARDAAQEPVTVEDALEGDRPDAKQAALLIDQAQKALDALRALVVSTPAPPDEIAQPVVDDGLDLPMTPPPQLQPQPFTRVYLGKPRTGRVKSVRECKDITLLRDIALFEPDRKLKLQARRRVKEVTQAAEMADAAGKAVAA